LNKERYWARQQQRLVLGIRQYERTPDYSKESLCRKCGTIWPKCSHCPKCGVRVKNTQKFRKKDGVHRY
jgi:rubrerythrin